MVTIYVLIIQLKTLLFKRNIIREHSLVPFHRIPLYSHLMSLLYFQTEHLLKMNRTDQTISRFG